MTVYQRNFHLHLLGRVSSHSPSYDILQKLSLWSSSVPSTNAQVKIQTQNEMTAIKSLILCIYLVENTNWMFQRFHSIDFITVHFFLKKSSSWNKLVISDSNTDTCHFCPLTLYSFWINIWLSYFNRQDTPH